MLNFVNRFVYLANQPYICRKYKQSMKTKFEEFIELSIPSIEQRESMRLWVKNALNGIKNEKALILYGA